MAKDRVVCINDEGQNHPDIPKVKKGEIYTIRNFVENFKGQKWYQFDEIPDSPGMRPIYLISAFRPVDDSFGEWVEETVLKEIEYEIAAH